MFSAFLVSLLSAFLLLCLLSPAVRKSIMEGNDTLDAHEAGLALVASRTKSRQRDWATSLHGKIDYAETQTSTAFRCKLAHVNAEVQRLHVNHDSLHSFNLHVLATPGSDLADPFQANKTINHRSYPNATRSFNFELLQCTRLFVMAIPLFVFLKLSLGAFAECKFCKSCWYPLGPVIVVYIWIFTGRLGFLCVVHVSS
ncbi:hypothetical protein JVU11DRAFT_1370 [Chiua virens]|nr:hypothetical protein JVU11DRAFT_1370 [Chiua virens]